MGCRIEGIDLKVVVITGASAGIGLAATFKFVASGYKVVNLSRRACPNPDVVSIATDLSKPEFFDDVGDELISQVEEAETLHLVHNAARYLNDSALDTTDESLTSVFQTNVVAPNTLNRNLSPYMKSGSSIILVGSTLAEKAVAGCFSYATSKHAQVGLMRALCQDLAGRGIHTLMICPGFTDTEMLRSHVPDEAIDDVAAMSAFGRLVEPDEIADSIVWATEHPVLNGSVIHANLGQIEQ
ncbi:MAG: SDR family NAD(P)-dependent oxidoreductase [Gammaproteobacteria bacterium]|nr:SDR family NAD(P)-dependent oxidoreductase [Gammaproteobacteria bacterium]